ncbi:hypothetical protein AAII07_51595 [Microvirga sp. 0TCS3.31]
MFSMHIISDVPKTHPETHEVEYYKTLARLAEDRAWEIRRITALERARFEERLLEQEPTIKAYAEEQERLRITCENLRVDYEHLKALSQQMNDNAEHLKTELAATKAQLKTLHEAQETLGASRAHRLASAYVRLATGRSLFAQTLRLLRPAARVLNRIRRASS